MMNTNRSESNWNMVLGPYATPSSVRADAKTRGLSTRGYIRDAILQANYQGANHDLGEVFADLLRQIAKG